jgi:ankyrin repeat protein
MRSLSVVLALSGTLSSPTDSLGRSSFVVGPKATVYQEAYQLLDTVASLPPSSWRRTTRVSPIWLQQFQNIVEAGLVATEMDRVQVSDVDEETVGLSNRSAGKLYVHCVQTAWTEACTWLHQRMDLGSDIQKFAKNADLGDKARTTLLTRLERNIKFVLTCEERWILDEVLHEQDGYAAVHFAARMGRERVMKSLLRQGANTEKLDATGSTPLLISTMARHSKVVNLLIHHGAKVDTPDLNGWTALHAASMNGMMDILPVLVVHEALLNAVTKDGQTPISLAVHYQHLDVLEFLIDHLSDFDRPRVCELTLTQAVSTSSLSMVQLVHEQCYRSSYSKLDALLNAVRAGYSDIVQYLLKAGATMFSSPIKNLQCLTIAIESNRMDLVTMLLDNDTRLVSRRDEQGQTSLIYACRHGNADAIRILLRYGASTEDIDSTGRSCLGYLRRIDLKEFFKAFRRTRRA